MISMLLIMVGALLSLSFAEDPADKVVLLASMALIIVGVVVGEAL